MRDSQKGVDRFREQVFGVNDCAIDVVYRTSAEQGHVQLNVLSSSFIAQSVSHGNETYRAVSQSSELHIVFRTGSRCRESLSGHSTRLVRKQTKGLMVKSTWLRDLAADCVMASE